MNINQKVLSDLEIYDKILPKIDFTITKFGTIKLKSMFQTYNYDKNHLTRIHTIIQNIINAPKSRKYKINKLKVIDKFTPSIEWLFDDINTQNNNDLYFKNNIFNIKGLLSSVNFLKTYTPMFIFIIYGLIYIVLRYMGISIDIKSYLLSVYTSYQMMIASFLYMFINNENIIVINTL